MPAFDHVLVRVADRSAAERFYGPLLEPQGIEVFEPLEGITRYDNLGVTAADDEHPVTRGGRFGLAVAAPDLADGAVVEDPDGNRVQAAAGGDAGLVVDLELGVADLEAATRFYETIAPHTGFVLADRSADGARFRGGASTLVLVAGAPTQHLHLAFAASDEETVRAFHAAATGAGHPDNGEPGERPAYADGYYGAFVADPDGNNVEVVHMG